MQLLVKLIPPVLITTFATHAHFTIQNVEYRLQKASTRFAIMSRHVTNIIYRARSVDGMHNVMS